MNAVAAAVHAIRAQLRRQITDDLYRDGKDFPGPDGIDDLVDEEINSWDNVRLLNELATAS